VIGGRGGGWWDEGGEWTEDCYIVRKEKGSIGRGVGGGGGGEGGGGAAYVLIH